MSASVTTRVAPIEVKTSFWLWLVEVVISIVMGIIVIAVGSAAPDVLKAADGSEMVATISAGVAGAAVIIGGLLRGLFAVFMLRGRNWARIVLTVLGLLGAILGLVQIAQSGWLVIVAAIVALAAVILMFVGKANAYFRKTA
jgi:hypothetical protein